MLCYNLHSARPLWLDVLTRRSVVVVLPLWRVSPPLEGEVDDAALSLGGALSRPFIPFERSTHAYLATLLFSSQSYQGGRLIVPQNSFSCGGSPLRRSPE